MQSQTPSQPVCGPVALGWSSPSLFGENNLARVTSLVSAQAKQRATALHLEGVPNPTFLGALLPLCSGKEPPISVVALDAAVGAVQTPRAANAKLCALDKEEALAATEVALRALQWSETVEARFVRLHLGDVAGLSTLWRKARGHFLRGAAPEDSTPGDELLSARSALLPPHWTAVCRSLERLCNRALAMGKTLLIAYPRRPTDLPLPLELWLLLQDFAGAPLAPSLDLPAAHLASTMRLTPLSLSVRAFSPGPFHLIGDACGQVGALPPGWGEVDVPAVCGALPPDATLSFLPWSGLSFAEVGAALESLRAVWLGQRPVTDAAEAAAQSTSTTTDKGVILRW